jgi:hypothetical protein
MIENKKINNITLNFRLDQDYIVIAWKGKSNSIDPANELNPYFDHIINDFKNKTLIIDFCEFEYMNSSTVQPIVYFFKKLNENNIKTQVYYNKKTKWQVLSFQALEVIANMLKNIKIEGKD